MNMLRRMEVLLAAVVITGSSVAAEPGHGHWYKDWRWWVGEAFIAGISAADAHSSVTARSRCPVCNETNFFLGNHPSTGALAGLATAGLGIETTLHILSRKYCPDENSRWWRTASYVLVPGVAAAAIPGIVHNYGLSSQPKSAASLSRTFGYRQSWILPTMQMVSPTGPIGKADKPFMKPYGSGARSTGLR